MGGCELVGCVKECLNGRQRCGGRYPRVKSCIRPLWTVDDSHDPIQTPSEVAAPHTSSGLATALPVKLLTVRSETVSASTQDCPLPQPETLLAREAAEGRGALQRQNLQSLCRAQQRRETRVAVRVPRLAQDLTQGGHGRGVCG